MKWYQWQYKGPYWLLAIIVVAVWATLVSIVEELDTGPAATISVEELPADRNSPQE